MRFALLYARWQGSGWRRDKLEIDGTNEVTNMSEKINSCIALYKEQVNKSDIQKTYMFLLKYVMQVKASFEKSFSQVYSCGYVSPGYMDYS